MSNILSQVQQTAIGGVQSATAIVGATSALDFADISKDNVSGGSDTGSLVGAVAGVAYGYKKKHPILGGLVGESIGRNAPALMHAGARRQALVNIGETLAAAAASKASKKHPVIGFLVGRIVAGVIVHIGGLRG